MALKQKQNDLMTELDGIAAEPEHTYPLAPQETDQAQQAADAEITFPDPSNPDPIDPDIIHPAMIDPRDVIEPDGNIDPEQEEDPGADINPEPDADLPDVDKPDPQISRP